MDCRFPSIGLSSENCQLIPAVSGSCLGPAQSLQKSKTEIGTKELNFIGDFDDSGWPLVKVKLVVEEQNVSELGRMRECGNEGEQAAGSLCFPLLSSTSTTSTRNGVSPGRYGHGQWPPYLTMVMVVIINIIIASINIIMALYLTLS